jgi:hypothetical protein
VFPRRRSGGYRGGLRRRLVLLRRAQRNVERRRRIVRILVAGLEPLEFLDSVDDLGDVEKRVTLEADVNERGLHPGEDLGDPPLVDIADDTARFLALDEDLDDLIVLEDGDPRVEVARGDDHLLVHGHNSGERDEC